MAPAFWLLKFDGGPYDGTERRMLDAPARIECHLDDDERAAYGRGRDGEVYYYARRVTRAIEGERVAYYFFEGGNP